MEKNWLIRTKSNHILGPITKEKVLELYQNGSIKPDDEVCSGNGYWFFIREDELVQKYLINGEVQGFNPISEAKDVLTNAASSRMTAAPVDDITMVGGINLSLLKSGSQPPSTPAPAPEPPLVKEVPQKSQPQKEPAITETKKKNNVTVRPKTKAAAVQAKPLKKQDWLKYVGLLGFIFLFFLIYFRKTIIQHIFKGEITAISVQLISTAHAQVDSPEKKKSSLKAR